MKKRTKIEQLVRQIRIMNPQKLSSLENPVEYIQKKKMEVNKRLKEIKNIIIDNKL